MLGYCGINCETCPAYQGTVTSSLELLTKAADGDESKAKEWACLGCTPASQPFLSTYCGGCAVRGCAVERDVTNCAACADYDSCDKIREFMGTEPSKLRDRMTWLRARFLANTGKE